MGEGGVREIESFLSGIREKFAPCTLILFGSRARGDFIKESDYDIIIVSDGFEKKNFIRRMEEIYESWDEEVHLDVLCYTFREYEEKKKQIGIVSRAVEEGILL